MLGNQSYNYQQKMLGNQSYTVTSIKCRNSYVAYLHCIKGSEISRTISKISNGCISRSRAARAVLRPDLDSYILHLQSWKMLVQFFLFSTFFRFFPDFSTTFTWSFCHWQYKSFTQVFCHWKYVFYVGFMSLVASRLYSVCRNYTINST